MGRRIKDLTGKTFNRLTVIKRVENDKWNHPRWLCRCNCEKGSEIIVSGGSLKNGYTQSCGCLNKEITIDILKKYNTYNLIGDYGIGYTINDQPYYFDLEEYDKIKDYCWYKDKHGYIVTNSHEEKNIKMHRLIMDCPDDMEVDHIYGKKTRNDNRKENLRIVTRSQNGMNRGLSSNNTSSVTGVSWHNKKEKWQSRIMVNGNNIYLGIFSNFDEAVQVRKEAEKKYFREFAYKA